MCQAEVILERTRGVAFHLHWSDDGRCDRGHRRGRQKVRSFDHQSVSSTRGGQPCGRQHKRNAANPTGIFQQVRCKWRQRGRAWPERRYSDSPRAAALTLKKSSPRSRAGRVGHVLSRFKHSTHYAASQRRRCSELSMQESDDAEACSADQHK